jgi:protein O-GlcNAc transferase
MASRAINQGAARLEAVFQQAVELHQQGRPFQADALCSQVLSADPRHYSAWHLRGLLALEGGDSKQGIEWLERSLKINGKQVSAHSNLGNALLSIGRPAEALASLKQALRLKPDYAPALYNQGNALRELRQFREALNSYERVLRLQPDDALALNNKALVLLELAEPQLALAALERAVALDPRFIDARRNQAATLLKLNRPAEALAGFEGLLSTASKDADAWCGRGNALLALKRPDDAVQSYGRALEINSQHVDSLINRGHVLHSLQRSAEALRDYEQALHFAPESVLALNNCGNVLLATGRAEAALARYDHALQLLPGSPDTLYNRGAALRELRRYEESAQSFADLLQIDPQHAYALGNLFHLRMDSCDWTDYESLTRRLHAALAENRKVINPLSLLLLAESPEVPLECARAYVEEKHPGNSLLGPPALGLPALELRVESLGRSLGESRVESIGQSFVEPHGEPRIESRGEPSRKIRIAYVSADFREHPVSYLLVGALEQHDRECFEIIGVSLRGVEDTELGRRVAAAFDRVIDATALSDRETAKLLRELEVDVAIDLMGLTQGMRLGIFAHRAAPVQVNYLGYAGTLGADYMDYVLADEVVIPPGQERWYAEKVIRLPHCYLPNDARRAIGPTPSREQAGLPAQGLVFCAFTNAYKINPPVFDIWMRLLREVRQSVLWLRAVDPATRSNLQREAAERGVDAQRLVFAPHVASMADHLARHQLADLYLDTLPYNAHSTTCDALWAGVPVITCAGGSFAGRVAASALQAVGLPELVAASLEEYGQLALELACDSRKLRDLRQRLTDNRTVKPLFDTVGYTRRLEAAFRVMHQRAMQGLAPEVFDVAVD